MKSSIFLAGVGAILAAASPALTDLVIKWVTVIVTEGEERATTCGNSTTSTSTTSSTPEPTTSNSPIAIVTTPKPTTTAAPALAPAESSTVQEVATKASSSVSLASPTDFASTALYHHNVHRFNHSSPAITWGESYAYAAAIIAANCVFQHNMTVDGGGYGQNIAMWASSGNAKTLGASMAMAQAATNMWYNGEVTKWPAADYGNPNPDFTDFEGWGHFSQVVWKESQQVGCASQYCPPGTMVQGMGAWFTVCNYYPAGNMGGEYGANVLPPLGEATVTA